MATYKKRGYKPKTKAEQNEEFDENSTTAEVFNTLDESASKTEEWAVENQKYIFLVVGIIAIVVLGYLGYQNFIVEPKASEGMNEMYVAQKNFTDAVNGSSKDSLFTLSLNGAEGKFGMVDIAEEYKGTPAGNLANYYAGIAYLNLRDYKNAIAYLSDFETDDEILGPITEGSIGDAFAQLNQPEDALEQYEKAFKMNTNDYTTPMYLYKAGTVASNMGDTDKALEYFRRIKTEFSKSTEAQNIDVFIGRAEASVN